MKLYFKDTKDGYYEFENTVPSSWYSHLIPTTQAFPTLEQVKASQLLFIETSYSIAISAPISYLGTFFQADRESQSLIGDVLAAQAGITPTGFGWYDINNVKVNMTNAQLQGLANAILTRGQPLFDHKQTQKAAIRAATTITQVEAIVW